MRARSSRGCSTCALGRLDVGELDALGLDRGPVEAALPVGDVASLRVRALHELALGCGCTGDAERQRQNGQGDDLEGRSHALKKDGMLEKILDS